jgi:hypothetical protein
MRMETYIIAIIWSLINIASIGIEYEFGLNSYFFTTLFLFGFIIIYFVGWLIEEIVK